MDVPPDPLSLDELQGHKFETALRGYDREAVERFRARVLTTIERLERQVEDLQRRLDEAGVRSAPDLEAELEQVGADVSRILLDARAAADSMRERAAADAARWRAEADADVTRMREEAQRDAVELRRSAWEVGTEMLEQAQAAAAELVDLAAKDALLIRAEAEREALRLVTDARRDLEEERRDARTEAERMIMEARAESQRLLDAARQSAETAQQRARALEQRRAELMEELEAARRSIGQLESEIDSRRESLQSAGLGEAGGVRVISSEEANNEGWLDEDMTVKLVPPTRIIEDEPVDADALADEVRRLREENAAEAGVPEVGTEELGAVEPEAAKTASAETATDVVPLDDEVAEVEPEVVAVIEADDLAAAADDLGPDVVVEAAEPAPAAAAPPAAPSNGAAKSAADDLSDLFAKLRTPAEPAPEEAPPTLADEGVATPAQPSTSVPDGAGSEAAGPEEADAAAPSPTEDTASSVVATAASGPATGEDPFELRDRLLLPIHNRALREVKRRLVELQNRVLEELRLDEGWSPDGVMFEAELGDDVRRLAREAMVAGFAAAAELVGAKDTPRPGGLEPVALVDDFVAGLTAAVADALAEARTSGAGARQVAASVSKVFRAWRTDEAERRLRHGSFAAYHQGVVAGLAALGVSRVMAVAPGRACGECPAGTGSSWDPAANVPDGLSLPPAGPGCEATLVPAA